MELVFKGEYIAKNDEEYFNMVVRIFSEAFIYDRDYHLTNRELELLYCAFKAIKNGRRNILDRQVIREYFQPFGKKQTVQIWLPKVVDKLFLVNRGDDYYINGDLEKLIKMNNTEFSLKIVESGD